ncbi:MAG: molybdopterin-guanine dinucleotide biosynthesis protein MobA [Chthoniobacteraceae bacterium]|nr:molybdopterin-guanine dinucleotide biosynthesis protein MobA [Chthoniobacteraceae bacterium]
MGVDKAGVIVAGEPLWRRQLALLRAVNPDELLVSCRPGSGYFDSEQNIILIHDTVLDLGPLGGIAAVLQKARFDFILVLAIDLPLITAQFLFRLIAASNRHGKGIVPRDEEWYQPLAAIYPRACLPLIEKHLLGPDRSMQYFVKAALHSGFVSEYPLAEAERSLFKNLNTVADLF